MKAQPVRALTAIRGVAAWWIVAYHFREALPGGVPQPVLGVVAHGYLAVDLFFELSGFVLALNYFHDFRQYDAGRHLIFVGLRIARIYPLHLFMMLLYLANPLAIGLLSSIGAPGERYDPGYYVLSLLLMQNWGFSRILAWNVPAWSISTEWFVYLLFPALVGIFSRTARGRAATIACAALLLVALGWMFRTAGVGLGGDIPTWGLPRCLLEFCIGICLCRLSAEHPPGAVASTVAAVLGTLCFAAYAAWPIPDYAIVPVGFAFLIYGMAHDRGILAALLRPRVFEWLGLVSYSTYLVHYFVRDWVKFATPAADLSKGLPFLAYVVVTLAASAVLYRAVEVPGRRGLRAVTGRLLPVRPA